MDCLWTTHLPINGIPSVDYINHMWTFSATNDVTAISRKFKLIIWCLFEWCLNDDKTQLIVICSSNLYYNEHDAIILHVKCLTLSWTLTSVGFSTNWANCWELIHNGWIFSRDYSLIRERKSHWTLSEWMVKIRFRSADGKITWLMNNSYDQAMFQGSPYRKFEVVLDVAERIGQRIGKRLRWGFRKVSSHLENRMDEGDLHRRDSEDSPRKWAVSRLEESTRYGWSNGEA